MNAELMSMANSLFLRLFRISSSRGGEDYECD